VNSFSSGQSPLIGCREHSNQLLSLVEVEKFIDLLEKVSAQWIPECCHL
jgi:hypothetical protein